MGPYGNRILRQQRLQGLVPSAGGAWKRIELVGPRDFETFQAAWKVVENLVIFENTVDFGVFLEFYRRRILRYHDKFGHQFWHLLYQALVRCLGEHMPAVLVRGTRERARALAAVPPERHALDPDRPWQWVIQQVTIDAGGWWDDQFEEPAAKMPGASSTPLVREALGDDAPIERGSARTAAPGGGGEVAAPRRQPKATPGARSRTPQHYTTGDGDAERYSHNRGTRNESKALCASFNTTGCDPSHPQYPSICPRDWSKAHQCDRCLSTDHGSGPGGCTRTPRTPGSILRLAAGKGGGKGGNGRKGGKRGK
jgi:hypothetical protein